MPESNDAKTLSILYKRKGYFDAKRDEILQQFIQTDAHTKLIESIKEIVNEIVHKKPELLLKNKGQLAALIEGIILRQSSSGTMNKLDLSDLVLSEHNVYDIFEEEVKRSTEGSAELKEDVRRVLRELKEGS
jgi:COMPASS component SHG1